MNALHTLHASVKNVKIHVKPIRVVSTQNVWLEIIGLCVFVLKDLLVIHSPFVKNVSLDILIFILKIILVDASRFLVHPKFEFLF